MLDQRLSAEERREGIVKAVLPLFARKGFANTTTRELAEAADVSEALIYKHFPSKESLYAEIQNTGCKDKDRGLEKLADAEPSTSTLVHIVYYLLRTIVMGKPGDTISWEAKHRMILNSCLEDGEFTRVLYENRFSCCFNKVQTCLVAAEETGDICEEPGQPRKPRAVRASRGGHDCHSAPAQKAGDRLQSRSRGTLPPSRLVCAARRRSDRPGDRAALQSENFIRLFRRRQRLKFLLE